MVRRAGEEDSGVQAAGVGWGLGSPPAGTAAARTPPSHGWARAFPGGAGQCRGPPRRAGPADTQQGHLRDPRPPSARSKPHQQPLAPTPHAPGEGHEAPARVGEARGLLPPFRTPQHSILTSSGEKWWGGASIWGARRKDKVSGRPGPGPGRGRLLAEQARAQGAGAEPPPTRVAHLFPQQASWGSGPRVAFLLPWPAVAEVHRRSAVPAA